MRSQTDGENYKDEEKKWERCRLRKGEIKKDKGIQIKMDEDWGWKWKGRWRMGGEKMLKDR